MPSRGAGDRRRQLAGFPHVVPVQVPDHGLGSTLTDMESWCLDRAGPDSYMVQPGDDRIAFRFRDQGTADAFAQVFGLQVEPG